MTGFLKKKRKKKKKKKKKNRLKHYLFYFDYTKKSHRTYTRVLEGANVGVLWHYVVEETDLPGENHRHWTGDHYPATCRRRGSNPGRSSSIELVQATVADSWTNPWMMKEIQI